MTDKIVAFVGEMFRYVEGSYYAKQTSAAFLQDAVGKENVFVASFSTSSEDGVPKDYSTKVEEAFFYNFPSYKSTKDFIIKCLTKKNFYSEYVAVSDRIIEKHKGDFFWVRTPTMGSIVFALRVLKAEQKLLNHICADASNAWRGNKYSFYEKIFGYITSKLIRYYLKKICVSPFSLNLCTGDVLESFSAQYAPSRTRQFVDVMLRDVQNVKRDEKKNKLDLLFVGRIVRDKGIFDLISLMARFDSGIHLRVVGDGPDMHDLKNLVSSKDLSRKIEILGQLKHKDISQLYARSDLVVVPSNNYYEGFPRVIMEAWAHGLPVIVSRVGGVLAFLRHGENGLVFNKGNIEELYELLVRCKNDAQLLKSLEVGARSMSKVSMQQYWINQLLIWMKEFPCEQVAPLVLEKSKTN